ncbi:hypothetical protein M4D55_00095 [Metabacillus idriensis]|uniref:hypothetical protein n=1 Tax=Metabacillus idriensis TaxID=324768 RepID=UPI0020409A8B|nr:hypothetical protein [Metabacillus idriensis]MCM3594182.1 hypothetical protein [Metabacillus idriensis]
MRQISSIFVIVLLLLLVGCGQDSSDKTGSTAIIVIINSYEYNGTSEELNSNYKTDEKIGTISLKTEPNVMPKEKQSNFYEVGSEIFSVEGTDDYIIVKDKNNKEHLLKKVTNEG